MLQDLSNLIKDKPISDINLTGFIYTEDGIAEFTPLLTFVYLKFGNEYLEFASVEQYSKLRLLRTRAIRHEFEFVPEFLPAVSSISNLLFVNPDSINNIVSNIKLYNFELIMDEVICDALQMTLKNGQILFFDPTFVSGINVGGIEQYEFWRTNNVGKHVNNIEIDF